MAFTQSAKLKAMAIVHIFETSRVFGDYAGYAVLDDGAGVSYGISQFTHRSGSLALVIERYLRSGASLGRTVMRRNLPLLQSRYPAAIKLAAKNRQLEGALKAASATAEMRAAQRSMAFELYLRPATEACERSLFVTPLALAVIYDSINHGSWERIRDHVRVPRPTRQTGSIGFEKAWIGEYVRRRHRWLLSIPRLRPTAYRTSFFLSQIAQQNWDLDLPIFVHGVAVRDHDIRDASQPAPTQSQPGTSTDDRPQTRAIPADPSAHAGRLDTARESVDAAAAAYDQLDAIARTVLTRSDAAKSLWTTIAGTAWQSIWAVVSFLIGLPNVVWLLVALIVATLMLFYLYRQFALGKIRESATHHQ